MKGGMRKESSRMIAKSGVHIQIQSNISSWISIKSVGRRRNEKLKFTFLLISDLYSLRPI